MATDQSAAGIGLRFLEEQDYIEGYVRFLRRKSTIHHTQIIELNRILTRFGIDPLPIRPTDGLSIHGPANDFGPLLGCLCDHECRVEDMIADCKTRLETDPRLIAPSCAEEHFGVFREWISYFVENLSDTPDKVEIDNARRHAISTAPAADEEISVEARNVTNNHRLHGAEEKIAETHRHYAGMSKEKEDLAEDEKLMEDVERDIDQLSPTGS